MERRWSFLQQWCAPLRSRLAIHRERQNRVPKYKYGGICVQLPANLDDLPALRCGLFLLAMVAHVDHDAWKWVLVDYCALDVVGHEELFESATFRPQFVFAPSVAVWEDPQWPKELFAEFCSGLTDHQAIAFVDAVTKIAAMSTITIQEELRIPVILSFSPTGDGYRSLPNIVEQVFAALQLERNNCTCSSYQQHAVHCNAMRPRCSFELKTMDVNMAECTLKRNLVDLARLLVRNVDQAAVGCFKMNLQHGDDMILYGHDVQVYDYSLVWSFGELLAQTLVVPQQPVFKRIELACQFIGEIELARLFSAVAATRSTTTLAISLLHDRIDSASRRWLWERMAYSLFSKHAYSTITTVELSGVSLRNDDIDAITSVLTAEDPIKMLFGLGAGASSDSHAHRLTDEAIRRSVRLEGGTPVVPMPMHPDEPSVSTMQTSWMLPTSVDGVKVLSDDGESVDIDVLIPGYGLCRTQRDQVIHGFDTREICDVTELSLSFARDFDAWTGLPRFLQLVGQPLTSLSLFMPVWSPISSLDLFAVCRWCPNLQTLIVERGIKVNTSSVIRAFRECDLRISELQCLFNDVPTFMRELSLPDTRLARQLRRLVIEFPYQVRHSLIVSRDMAAILDMLSSNRTLRYLDVLVHPSEYHLNIESFTMHHSEKLALVADPELLDCCIAFLSVAVPVNRARGFKRTAFMPEEPTLPHMCLDHHALSLVFDFAGLRTRRRVFLRQYPTG